MRRRVKRLENRTVDVPFGDVCRTAIVMSAIDKRSKGMNARCRLMDSDR